MTARPLPAPGGALREARASWVLAAARPGDRAVRATTGGWPTSRQLQVLLGLLWLVDAGLQFQPYMLSRKFVTRILRPALAGLPGPLARPGVVGERIVEHHVVIVDPLFATVQLAIALGILWPRTARLGLAASIPWAFGVWWIGEGFGGLATGTSPLAGAPGAAVLLAVLAVLAWPDRRRPDATAAVAAEAGSTAEASPFGRRGARAAWTLVWGVAAAMSALPANSSPSGPSRLFASMSAGEPGWMAHLDGDLAGLFARRGTEVSLLLVVATLLSALAIWAPRWRRPTIALAVVLAALFWVTEDFGGVFSGAATDLNTGPLLAVLALAYRPRRAGPAAPRATARPLSAPGAESEYLRGQTSPDTSHKDPPCTVELSPQPSSSR